MADTKPILLLDGDLILYRNAIACEREVRWDDQNHVLLCNVENAWCNIKAAIEHIQDRLGSEQSILCFSEGRSFRYGILPTYKSNREGQRKPLGYAELVQRARDTYESRSLPGLEADDVMGILATKPDKRKRIIVSDDKDMKTIPGLLYRQGELQDIQDADYWHMYQTLIGDGADGYAGLPGCGPKTAEKILAGGATELWPLVVKAFESKGLTEDDAITQARLARICRWSDWDNEKKEVILWTPPTT